MCCVCPPDTHFNHAHKRNAHIFVAANGSTPGLRAIHCVRAYDNRCSHVLETDRQRQLMGTHRNIITLKLSDYFRLIDHATLLWACVWHKSSNVNSPWMFGPEQTLLHRLDCCCFFHAYVGLLTYHLGFICEANNHIMHMHWIQNEKHRNRPP